ncbi:MAG: electron transfer flavoprotein subunit beta/FixA family protein [Nitrospinota bacterium]
MDIIVCFKQVLDPDIPSRDFKVDESAKRVIPPPNVSPVINNFDEYALEASVQLKESLGGAITVLTVGGGDTMDNIKKALAMGCDEAVLLNDESFAGSDAFGSAHALAAAIRKIARFDLILFGRVSSDWSSGATGIAVAEILGLPSVSQVQKIEPEEGKLRVERVLEDGSAAYEVPLPCVLTLSNEINEPRLPTVPGILKASRKKVPTWTASDLDLSAGDFGAEASRERLLRLYVPKHESRCQLVEGESPEEAAGKLALVLREKKII